MVRNWLITGGCGFIGTSLIQKLLELDGTINVAMLNPDRKLADETLYSISWRPVRPNELKMIDPYITDM